MVPINHMPLIHHLVYQFITFLHTRVWESVFYEQICPLITGDSKICRRVEFSVVDEVRK